MIKIQTPILELTTPTLPITFKGNTIGFAKTIKVNKLEGSQDIYLEPTFHGRYRRKFASDRFNFTFSISHTGKTFEGVSVSIKMIKP
jgi:hypothetical protein